ncbi:MAG TPA: hypothetical protein VJL80_06315 [Aeromicrobium sp.]|nr:hypothetical protein [Aeromicrobium sp.]HKY57633.1 hypothetical protein [Aeromicrobium sp.]
MTEAPQSDLPKTYNLDEVADALGMSERWVRSKLKGVEHIRAGHKIRFTEEQYQAFRKSLAVNTEQANVTSITTGKKKSR